MADFNKVMLIGRLTRDPQLRYLPSQTAVCDFGLATGRRYKMQNGEEREETTFVDCSILGRGAEVFNQYCQKGKLVFLEGRLKLDQWDDKQTGQKRSKLSVVVEHFQFLGGRDGGGGSESDEGGQRSYGRPGGYGSGGNAPRGNAPRGNAPRNDPSPPDDQPPYGDEQQFKEDDIPF